MPYHGISSDGIGASCGVSAETVAVGVGSSLRGDPYRVKPLPPTELSHWSRNTRRVARAQAWMPPPA